MPPVDRGRLCSIGLEIGTVWRSPREQSPVPRNAPAPEIPAELGEKPGRCHSMCGDWGRIFAPRFRAWVERADGSVEWLTDLLVCHTGGQACGAYLFLGQNVPGIPTLLKCIRINRFLWS